MYLELFAGTRDGFVSDTYIYFFFGNTALGFKKCIVFEVGRTEINFSFTNLMVV